jgi:hypothetical protein
MAQISPIGARDRWPGRSVHVAVGKTMRLNLSGPLQIGVICEICGYLFFPFSRFLYPENLSAEHLKCMLGAHPLEGRPIRWKEFFFHHSRSAATR